MTKTTTEGSRSMTPLEEQEKEAQEYWGRKIAATKAAAETDRIRVEIATRVMASMAGTDRVMADAKNHAETLGESCASFVAGVAVELADALIAELNKKAE